MIRACSREREVLLAAARGWTEPADADVALHASECPHCLDVTVAAEAIRERCAREIEGARPPSAALVWWRLDRRLRADRARLVQRPLTVVHGVAAAVAFGIALALLQLARPWMGGALVDTVASAGTAWTLLAERSASAPSVAVPFVLMGIAVLVLAPTAIYLGFAKDDR